MIYDDGFVAFINGREVVRSPGFGSPAVPLTHTLRSGSKHDDEEPETVFPLALPTGLLRAGENVLAIEVHNEYKKSSDACMIPRLVARIAADPNPRRPASSPTQQCGARLHWRPKLETLGSGGILRAVFFIYH